MPEEEPGILWPCGCTTWTEGEFFFINACDNPSCDVLRIVKERTAAQGGTIVDEREMDI